MAAQDWAVSAIDDACHALNTRETRDERNALIAVRVAFDELIAADKEFDEACAGLNIPNVIDSEYPTPTEIAMARERFRNAETRRASALAAVGQSL